MSICSTRLEALYACGFDGSYAVGRDDSGRFSKAIRVKCSQCEALCINGIACHETGCSNERDTEAEDAREEAYDARDDEDASEDEDVAAWREVSRS